jgi:hypothetical protein
VGKKHRPHGAVRLAGGLNAAGAALLLRRNIG